MGEKIRKDPLRLRPVAQADARRDDGLCGAFAVARRIARVPHADSGCAERSIAARSGRHPHFAAILPRADWEVRA